MVDPLNAVGAAGAALHLTAEAWKLGKKLYKLYEDTQKVDETVKNLSAQVTTLGDTSNFVHEQLEEIVNASKSNDIPDYDKDGRLWKCICVEVEQCRTTIGSLRAMVDTVKEEGSNFITQARRQLRLNKSKEEMAAIRQRIATHNTSLHTILQVITIRVAHLAPGLANSDLRPRLDDLAARIQLLQETMQDLKIQGSQSYEGDAVIDCAKDVMQNGVILYEESVANGSIYGGREGADGNVRVAAWVGTLESLHEESRLSDSATRSSVTRSSQPPSIFSDDNRNTVASVETPFSSDGTTAIEHLHESDKETSDDDDDGDITMFKHALQEGALAFEEKEWAEANGLFQEALSMLHQSSTRFSALCDTLELQYKLAVCAYNLDELTVAEEALSSLTQQMPSNDKQRRTVCDARYLLAQVYIRLGKLDLARSTCESAADGRRRLLGKSHDSYYETLALCSKIYQLLNNPARARIAGSMIPMARRSDLLEAASELIKDEPPFLFGPPGRSSTAQFSDTSTFNLHPPVRTSTSQWSDASTVVASESRGSIGNPADAGKSGATSPNHNQLLSVSRHGSDGTLEKPPLPKRPSQDGGTSATSPKEDNLEPERSDSISVSSLSFKSPRQSSVGLTSRPTVVRAESSQIEKLDLDLKPSDSEYPTVDVELSRSESVVQTPLIEIENTSGTPLRRPSTQSRDTASPYFRRMTGTHMDSSARSNALWELSIADKNLTKLEKLIFKDKGGAAIETLWTDPECYRLQDRAGQDRPTALHLAILFGDLAIAKMLIKKGPPGSLIVPRGSRFNEPFVADVFSALDLAVAVRRVPMIQMILDEGSKTTPNAALCMSDRWLKVTSCDSIQDIISTLAFLIDCGWDLHKFGTSLICAAMAITYDPAFRQPLIEYLISAGAMTLPDVRQKPGDWGQDGYTTDALPLHLAVKERHVDLIPLLLETEPQRQLEARNEWGTDILGAAVANYLELSFKLVPGNGQRRALSLQVIRHLLEAGADVNTQGTIRYTMIGIMSMSIKTEFASALGLARKHKSKCKELVSLLESYSERGGKEDHLNIIKNLESLVSERL